MNEFTSFQKNIWRLILSKLDSEYLYIISKVCKTFFFMLKEDEIFWSLYVKQLLNIQKLSKENKSWKELFLSSFIEWDQRNLFGNYKVYGKDKKILTDEKNGDWGCVLTKQHLLEGVLYPFQIDIVPTNIALGVAFQNTELRGHSPFGSDEYRFGYYQNTNKNGEFYTTSRQGKVLEKKKNYSENGTISFYIHKGSFSDKENTLATVSFFNKNVNETKHEYIFTAKKIPVLAGQKMYGFVSNFQSMSI
eukprot:TRINITY_DN10315_c0_g1_i1.p1 TRINITY_DN10315_c0_g1~~TRINITY_DN10315_c0_g1_i1.p1  ORF type:complete len:260 (-),score=51.56 TRINITY_DN10315_c0_g1_i1:52-795(-)